MEVPTARLMSEGQMRVGFSLIDPYRSYYVAFAPFSFIEIDGRFQEIMGVKVSPGSPNWQGYGNYKDKVLDFKIRLVRESKYRPAIALGIMDPQGTRLAASQYIAISKQFYPFDFTIGYGNGHYGDRPLPSSDESFKLEIFQNSSTWRSEGNYFGGVQMALTDKLLFMVEYSPIKYGRLPGAYNEKNFRHPSDSHVNFGLRYRPWDWLETDLSYQRGNEIGFNIALSFDLGRPLIPLYDQPYRELSQLRAKPLDIRILTALETLKFSNIRLRTQAPDIEIEVQNDRFYYTTRAISMILKSLAPIIAGQKDYALGDVHLILSHNGVPTLSFTVPCVDVVAYFKNEEYTAGEFLSLTRMDMDVRENLKAPIRDRNWWDWGAKPSFQPFLNDPSGFFKCRFGASGWISLTPWRGGSFVTGIEGFVQNNISSVNAPAPQAVRSDYWLYSRENFNMNRLLYEHIDKLPYNTYWRFAGGMLETQYGGMDMEVARPFMNGRFLVGVSGSVVKKRAADQVLKFKENDWQDYYKTAFLNTRWNIPEIETYIDLKSGRFLAGDKGVRAQISKFFNGVILSAWYSSTSTSFFNDNYNRGYHDKGIAITIPLRLLIGTDSRTSYHFGFSPWNRDVAQDIDHFTDLFEYIGRDTPMHLKKDFLTKDRGVQF